MRLGQLKIKYKMTLWYVLLTMLLMAVFLPLLIVATHRILLNNEEDELKQFYSQLSALIEIEDGTVLFENEVPFPNEISYLITVKNGKVAASSGDTTVFDQVPFIAGALRSVKSGSTNWLLTDGIYESEKQSAAIRMARPLFEVDRVVDTMKLISIICIPVFLLTAVLSGLFLAQRSLQPIKRVIKSSKIIASGNLSERIEPTGSKDEIGELIQTINAMTDNLEIAFAREKRFTSDASHELRTPVSIIMAYAETLLAGDTLLNEDKKYAEVILTESQRMQHIISQLLTLTRGSEGRYPIQMEVLSINDLIAGVAAQLSDMLDEKRIQLVYEVPPGTSIYGDQSLLTQMLLNFLENAIKYGKPEGHICIIASDDSGWLKLIVKDDGIGIAQENLPKIFERFFRADAIRDRTGSGLGLSIARWIIDAHHGKIDVQSELGMGTTFTILLPQQENKTNS